MGFFIEAALTGGLIRQKEPLDRAFKYLLNNYSEISIDLLLKRQ
ncbi:hypothetical protein SD77_3151 [Bacillus badius]|uniref:Transcriptional regulator, TetR family n=1 Tax=Bacillus badius TaxID=1455 RepID=A0ABR5AX12_BACBA|nr:hypothetical protein SD78_0252 [Bacillus badius]KIL79285.1 hypothetical protein SD77_3151 [Bacillus badius]